MTKTSTPRPGAGSRSSRAAIAASWQSCGSTLKFKAPNPKHEIPNKHEIQSTDDQSASCASFRSFEFPVLDLFGISCFGFGASHTWHANVVGCFGCFALAPRRAFL